MASSPKPDLARQRLLTMQAAGALVLAKLLVAFVPLRFWRGSLGLGEAHAGGVGEAGGQFLAGRVERAAARLPFDTKCLPRAMALSWMLRRRKQAHEVVIAVRPPDLREGDDGLHAWVEAGNATLIGDLPGPWHEIYRAR
ncbi:MAG: lasso peptide biosynthesis B2 protein [Sphingomonadaceae bacterium]